MHSAWRDTCEKHMMQMHRTMNDRTATTVHNLKLHTCTLSWFRIDAVQACHITSQPEVPHKQMTKHKSRNFSILMYVLMCVAIGLFCTSSRNITWRGCTTSILNQPLHVQHQLMCESRPYATCFMEEVARQTCYVLHWLVFHSVLGILAFTSKQ